MSEVLIRQLPGDWHIASSSKEVLIITVVVILPLTPSNAS